MKNYLNKDIKVFISSPFHPEREVEEIKEFIDEYEIEYGKKPGIISALTYESLLFLNECFENKKIQKREDLLRCFENLKKFKGIAGEYNFEEHTPKRGVWILKASEKGFEPLFEMKIE